ncbi:hypothetical protein F0562_008466 [Nyssa sinensis]|uniref:ATP-dependent Clp protease proteolytic subunit n=1 Tax=Nyssa sinensis TaxID=561372 RepID=A0A5J5AAJ0_9ASTE|nr:hypothetical protein F0562_008466 [Nyssa sinensis]
MVGGGLRSVGDGDVVRIKDGGWGDGLDRRAGVRGGAGLESVMVEIGERGSGVESGNRFGMPLSRIAPQSPAGPARGQVDDIRNEANELLRIRDYLFKELANKTASLLIRMKRFTAQEALEYGLIDRIVRPPRIKADAPRKDAGTGLR